MPTKKCNGVNVDNLKNPIVPVSEWDRYDERINLARRHFKKAHPAAEWGPAGRFYAGLRYSSNREVMIRIVSACTSRNDFEGNKTKWFEAGLRECASADHWYQFEKDYGNHE